MIDRYSLQKIFILSFFIYLFVLAIAPVSVDIFYSANSIKFFAVSFLCFFLGSLIVVPRIKLVRRTYSPLSIQCKSSGIERNNRFNDMFYSRNSRNILIFLVLVGFVLRLIDYYYFRGISASDDSSTARVLSLKNHASLISIFGAGFMSLFMLPLHICYERKKMLLVVSKIDFLISGCMFLFPCYFALMFKSRFQAILPILIFLSYVIHYHKIKSKELIFFAFISILSLLIIYLFFINRLSQSGVSLLYSIYHSGYAFTLKPMLNDIGDYSNLYLFIINLFQYYLHGMFEFLYMFDHMQPHMLHIFSGGVFSKAFDIVTGNINAPADASFRAGVYHTFLGSVYQAYGFLAPLVMFIWGVLFQCIFNKSKRCLAFYPLRALLTIVVLLFPSLNMINSAHSMYYIISMLSYIFIINIILFLSKKTSLTSKTGASS